ncbi:MAG: ankyrin repeat domain-containing protein [Treponema sp.]|jgi:ankyrin repeat protein|nr:ankyrin repeat domain-containing protein [Treponema sp.]
MKKIKILIVFIISLIFNFFPNSLLWGDDDPPMPLYLVVEECNRIKVGREYGNATNEQMDSAIEGVRQLLEAGADPNMRIPYFESAYIFGYGASLWSFGEGTTLLMLSRVAKVTALLIEYGARVNDQDNYGRTALMISAFFDDYPYSNDINLIFRILLENGADINIQNHTGQTALHFAINGGNDEEIELLINNGINVNIRDKKGWSPLILANILYKHEPTIEMMIQILTNAGAVLGENDFNTIKIFKAKNMWWDDEINMSYADR